MAIGSSFEPLKPRVADRAARPSRRGAVAASGAGRFAFPPLGVAPDPLTPERAAQPMEPPPSAAPSYGEAELAEATARARAEGRAEAETRVRAAMAESIEQRTSMALAAIARELTAGREGLERSLAARAKASGELALALARAIVPRALEGRPLADVEAMLVELVRRLEGHPRLELALAPDLVAAGDGLLRRVAEDAGHRGEIEVRADPRLAAGDARLSWGDGRAERALAGLEREIAALVEAWLPAEPATAPTPEHQPAPAAAPGESEEVEGD